MHLLESHLLESHLLEPDLLEAADLERRRLSNGFARSRAIDDATRSASKKWTIYRAHAKRMVLFNHP